MSSERLKKIGAVDRED